MRKQLKQIIVVLAVAAATVPAARATLVNQLVATADLGPAMDIYQSAPTDSWELGFQFQVTGSDRKINALGFIDLNNTAPKTGATGDGLIGPEIVSLWTDAGALLGTVTVPSGTSGILDGVWRYAQLSSSITLTNGGVYRISERALSDDAQRGNQGASGNAVDIPGSGLSIITSAALLAPGFPANLGAATAYGLPNAALLVPEPSTALLLGLGGVLLLRRVRQPRA